MRKAKQLNTRSIYFPEKTLKALEKISCFPLTVVEAPMGYGKTTAVRECLKNTDAKTLWLWIHDSSIAAFWKGFCRKIGEIDRERAENLEACGLPDDSVSWQTVLNLIEDIDFPCNTVFVIDDYHVAATPELNYFIEFLTRNEIPNFRLILIVRHVNLDNMEELKLKGYLLHIAKEEFEFSFDDIKAYYRLCGVALQDSDVRKLDDLTEGWISALYLLMLNYIEHGNFETTEDIYKLFGNMVYRRFSDEVKEFLNSLCLFESFTLEQAVYVSGNENAERLLAEIIQKNAFIKYDEILKAYKMHNIFTKYLKTIFAYQEENRKKQLYQHIAYYYMKNRDYLIAMEYFHAANDFDGMLDALESDRGHSIQSEQHEPMIRYYKECPAELKQRHPTAMLIFALCLFSFNEMDLFEQVCGEFSETIRSNNFLDQASLDNLLGEFEMLLSITEYNDIQKMREHIVKADGLLTHTVKFLDTRSSWTFGSPSVLYMFYRKAGMLEAEVKNLEEAASLYIRLTNGHGAGAASIMEAERDFNCGDFDSAEISVYKALYPADSHGQGDIIIGAMFLQARIAVMSGSYSYALYILKKMQEEMSRKRWYNLMYTVDLCDAFIHAELKQYEKIPLWIKEGSLNSSRVYYPVKGFFNIIYGRVLLISGEYLKLLGLSEQHIADSSAFPNLLGQIYTFIYMAAANQKIHRRDQAMNALERALDIALADKIYMPFVENCDYIEGMLKELYHKGSSREGLDQIFKIYQSYHAAVEQIKNEHFAESKPALTEREREIARLASGGLSNKQIGEKLFITENTVKMALKSVYGKLSINNRALLEQYLK